LSPCRWSPAFSFMAMFVLLIIDFSDLQHSGSCFFSPSGAVYAKKGATSLPLEQRRLHLPRSTQFLRKGSHLVRAISANLASAVDIVESSGKDAKRPPHRPAQHRRDSTPL
jgi:hypothetical protein